MVPKLLIGINPVTKFLEVIPNQRMSLVEVLGLLEMAKAQALENYKTRPEVILEQGDFGKYVGR